VVQVGVPEGGVHGAGFVGLAVAVIVRLITIFVGERVDRGEGVVAVLTGDVAVGIHIGGSHRSVAIVVVWVCAVCFGSTGIKADTAVITVASRRSVARGSKTGRGGDGRGAPTISILVQVPGRRCALLLVYKAIAVIINTVARFCRARKNVGLTIVTLGTGRKTVTIQVIAADGSVAVIVLGIRAIALFGTGVVAGLGVVTVLGVGDIAGGRGAGSQGPGGVPVAIGILVGIPLDFIGAFLVNAAIAIVIQAVAELRCIQTTVGVLVVAVHAGGAAVGIGVGIAYLTIAVKISWIQAIFFGRVRVKKGIDVVTVVANGAVAGWCGAGGGGGDAAPAVPVAIEIPDRRICGSGIVGEAVAVIILIITDFCGTDVDGRVFTVAVVLAQKAIAIGIDRGVGVPRLFEVPTAGGEQQKEAKAHGGGLRSGFYHNGGAPGSYIGRGRGG
jgi:hypothetical protein